MVPGPGFGPGSGVGLGAVGGSGVNIDGGGACVIGGGAMGSGIGASGIVGGAIGEGNAPKSMLKLDKSGIGGGGGSGIGGEATPMPPIGPIRRTSSYSRRFSSSERTSYAAEISLKRSSAAESPGFASG